MIDSMIHKTLHDGIAIVAHPLALDEARQLDEEHQRLLSRYYLAAGAGGLAVGVHTTQFAIHDADVGLYEPVLRIAAEEMNRVTDRPIVRVAGIVGETQQAVREASMARELGYHCGLLSLAAMKGADEATLLAHCQAVADAIPVFGFYLQGDIGGVDLPYSFWRRFCDIESVVAIKVAAFDRYRTFDVVRAVADAGRDDIALYTGNDDNIVMDLLTPWHIRVGDRIVERHFVGGLLGHWAVWTKAAVDLLEQCKAARQLESIPKELLARANEVTDCNAAIFDTANGFAGVIPAILTLLKEQCLVTTTQCLDPQEVLSDGQAVELARVKRAYPHLTDDAFVADQISEWR